MRYKVVILEEEPIKLKKQLEPYFSIHEDVFVIDKYSNHYRSTMLLLFHYIEVPINTSDDECKRIASKWIDKEIIRQQEIFCRKNRLPMFMPLSGICYSCRLNILSEIENRCDKELITGCPICHRSYCD